jgi:lipopolysaccharide export LptBFGC system permease protein LptF
MAFKKNYLDSFYSLKKAKAMAKSSVNYSLIDKKLMEFNLNKKKLNFLEEKFKFLSNERKKFLGLNDKKSKNKLKLIELNLMDLEGKFDRLSKSNQLLSMQITELFSDE